jgi:outer membrane protein assembly factor BamE (lipoprotein component of BamABCDE complex)
MSLGIGPRGALAAISVALLAAGCAPIREHQGYVLDQSLSAAVQPGVDNRESVLGTLGRPTFVGQFDDRDWYYVSRNTRQLAFNRPRPTENIVLHVRFDPTGNVERVERTGMELVENIRPSGDRTPTLGRESNLFEEIFGNIGAVGRQGRQGADTADNPQ